MNEKDLRKLIGKVKSGGCPGAALSRQMVG
jgi:hypothetical protein